MPSRAVWPPRLAPTAPTDVLGVTHEEGDLDGALTDRHKAGPLCLTAAVLIVLSQVMRLVGGRLLGPDWATTPAYPLIYTLALLGMGTLLLALTAIYTRESAALGRLGLIGYLTAFLGTVMVAGDWWFEAYAIPKIAAEAPEFLDLPPSGSALVGVHRHGRAVHGGLDPVRRRRPPRPRLPPRCRSAAADRRAGRTARPVDAVPDPAGDRDRLDRPFPRARRAEITTSSRAEVQT